MPNIVFYRQARVDGGVRTGIEVDGAGIESYEDGSAEHDPALIWYVDLRIQGDDLPEDPEDARQWLLDRKALVARVYRRLAQRLEVGMDPDIWPLQVKADDAPPGVQILAVCSCMSRISVRQMSKTVLEVAEHWKQYLQQLPQVQHQ